MAHTEKVGTEIGVATLRLLEKVVKEDPRLEPVHRVADLIDRRARYLEGFADYPSLPTTVRAWAAAFRAFELTHLAEGRELSSFPVRHELAEHHADIFFDGDEPVWELIGSDDSYWRMEAQTSVRGAILVALALDKPVPGNSPRPNLDTLTISFPPPQTL